MVHLTVSSSGNGISDSRESLILGHHRFQNFWKGTHVVLESLVLGNHWYPGITDSIIFGELFSTNIRFLTTRFQQFSIWNTMQLTKERNRACVAMQIELKFGQNWTIFGPKWSFGHQMCVPNSLENQLKKWNPIPKFQNQWFQGITDSRESLIPKPHEFPSKNFGIGDSLVSAIP